MGKGLQFGNAFVLLFKFLAYTFPILGAWIGDARIGRYNAVIIGVLICGLAHVIVCLLLSDQVPLYSPTIDDW